MGVAVDANVVIRWLVRDNVDLTDRSDKIMRAAISSSLVLDRLVLAEIAYVLKSFYKYPKPHIAQNLHVLLHASQFSIPDRELVTLTIALFETERPLSFEDCWLLALKRAGKVAGVHTFDEPLRKRL